jgi:hypothetical protein
LTFALGGNATFGSAPPVATAPIVAQSSLGGSLTFAVDGNAAFGSAPPAATAPVAAPFGLAPAVAAPVAAQPSSSLGGSFTFGSTTNVFGNPLAHGNGKDYGFPQAYNPSAAATPLLGVIGTGILGNSTAINPNANATNVGLRKKRGSTPVIDGNEENSDSYNSYKSTPNTKRRCIRKG